MSHKIDVADIRAKAHPLKWQTYGPALADEVERLSAENERLTTENKRLQWLMLPAVSGRGKPLGYLEELRAEIERLRATLEKWRPAVDRAMKWSEQLGNERDAKGFAAMLADFDSALESKP